MAETLPFTPTSNGRFRGAAPGPVAQLDRSIQLDNQLLGGSLAAGWGTEPRSRFAERIVKLVRSLTTAGIISVSGERTPYRAGPNAMRWVLGRTGSFFGADNAASLFFPAELAPERWTWLKTS
jgi:hypothetical protein